MKNFSLGVIFGIAVAAVGFQGLSVILDKGINQVKIIAKEASK